MPVLMEPELNKLKDKSPLGVYPTLETGEGQFISTSNAIVRYLANLSKTHFNLYGANNEEKAQVDSWLDWTQSELEPALLSWLYIVLGHLEADETQWNVSQAETKKLLQVLDKQFEKNTFLTGSKFYTIADLGLGSVLFYLFSLCLTKADLAKTPHLTRWFTALASLTQTQQVWGTFKWCTVVSKPAFAEKKADSKDKKETKEKKPKKEEPKKQEGPTKEEKEKEKMEKAEKALAEHNEKIKVWLEAPCSFDFEEFKREYCNTKPEDSWEPMFKWLWSHYKAEEVSFYYIRFQKYANELTNEMKTYNKIQGFIDRTDNKAARAGFGIYNMWFSKEENEYEIRGLYFFKGTELPYAFAIHDMMEYHDCVKMDISKPQDKELVETYLSSRYSADKLTYQGFELKEFFKWQ